MVQDMQSHKSKASTDVAVKVKVDAKLKTAESSSIWKDPGEKELRKYGKENKTELYFERVGVCWKAKLSIFSFMFPKFSYKGLGRSKTVQQAQFSASLAATSEFWKKEWLSLEKKPDTLQIFYQISRQKYLSPWIFVGNLSPQRIFFQFYQFSSWTRSSHS